MELARLSFITGKGGTGKSTLAAALALAVSGVRQCVLAELERRLSAARLLELDPSPNRSNGHPQPGRRIDLLTLSPRGELEAFVKRAVPIRSISERMVHSRTFGYVGAAAPGLAAFLTMERLRLLAGEAALEDRYVVVDAPSSGNALELLSVAAGVRQMAPLGTLNRLAAGIDSLLKDPHRFSAILTIVPEEPAVREALTVATRLRDELGVTRVSAVLNCIVDPLFDEDELSASHGLGGHGLLAARRLAMAGRADAAREALVSANLDFIELPMIFRPALTHRDLAGLARLLRAQLMVQ
jgi:hypothetical protein